MAWVPRTVPAVDGVERTLRGPEETKTRSLRENLVEGRGAPLTNSYAPRSGGRLANRLVPSISVGTADVISTPALIGALPETKW